MSDELSFAEIEDQRMELLPPRTVLSMFTTDTGSGDNGNSGGGGNSGFSVYDLLLKGKLLSDRALKCDITPVDWSR
jgi:hypothetical protein